MTSIYLTPFLLSSFYSFVRFLTQVDWPDDNIRVLDANGKDIPFAKYEPVIKKEKRGKESSMQINASPKDKVSPSASQSASSNTVGGLELLSSVSGNGGALAIQGHVRRNLAMSPPSVLENVPRVARRVSSPYFFCDFEGCNYKAKSMNHVRVHKEYQHEDKPWHHCRQSGCEFRSKISGEIGSHLLIVHGIIEETEGLHDFDFEEEKETNEGLKEGKPSYIEQIVGQLPIPPPQPFVPHFTTGAITDDVLDEKNCIPGRQIKM